MPNWTWAEDGVWELPDYPEIGKIVGKANIVTAWKAAMAQYPGVVFIATPGSIRDPCDLSRRTARARWSAIPLKREPWALCWHLGGLMAIASVWGFLEMFDLAPHVPAWSAFPLWAALIGPAQAFVRRRYR